MKATDKAKKTKELLSCLSDISSDETLDLDAEIKNNDERDLKQLLLDISDVNREDILLRCDDTSNDGKPHENPSTPKGPGFYDRNIKSQRLRLRNRTTTSQKNFHSLALMSPTMISTAPSLQEFFTPNARPKTSRGQSLFGNKFASADKLYKNQMNEKIFDEINITERYQEQIAYARTLRKTFSSKFRLSRYKDPKELAKDDQSDENKVLSSKLSNNNEKRMIRKTFFFKENHSKPVEKSEGAKQASEKEIAKPQETPFPRQSFSRSRIYVQIKNKAKGENSRVFITGRRDLL